MPKLARACAVVVAVATSLASGIAAAQIQSGVARKTAAPSIALGVPAANANANANAKTDVTARTSLGQRSSSNSSTRSGSPVTFTSGQPALNYQPADLLSAKDPVRREAVKEGVKDSVISARGAGTAATAASGTTTEFAPAPGVLRANMAPVTFNDAERVLSSRVLPANVNQGITTTGAASTTTKSTLSTRSTKISGDASPLGPASITELARSLRNHPDLIYQYVRNNVEYYPVFGIQSRTRRAARGSGTPASSSSASWACTTTRRASTRPPSAASCRPTPLATRTTSTCMPTWATTRPTGQTPPD